MAKLESLIVDLQVNTAELRKSLDEANAKVEKFGQKLDSLAKVITFDKIAGLAKQAAVALGEFALKGAELADHMGKLAQATGIGVEQFSKLAYAAQLSDMSADEFGSAMNKLNKNIAEAAAGSGHQAALFKAMGVAVTDAGGKARGTDAVFADLADRFADMDDGAGKALLSGELFGKSLGAKMIPLVNEGADGLAELGAEAERLGVAFDGSASKSAEAFNDNITRIRATIDGVAVRVAAQLTPALTRLSDQFLNSTETAGALKEVVDVLATALKLLASVGVVVGGVFDFIGTALGGMGAQIALILQGEFRQAAAVGEDLDRQLVASAKRTVSRVGAIWESGDAAVKTAEKTEKVMKTSGQATVASLKASEQAGKDFAASMKAVDKTIADLERKVASFDLGPIEQIEEQFKHGELAEHLKNIGASALEAESKIRDLASRLHELEMGKLSLEVDANIASTTREVGRDVRGRQRAHDTVGETPRGKLELQSGAFSSFDQALKVLADSTVKQAKKLGEAAMLRKDGDIEAAKRAELAAEQLGQLAERAGLAADAMTELEQMDFDEANEALQRFGAGVAAVGLQFVSKLGDLGDVIQAGIQGAESGGIWGAIIAVVIELLSKFERFSEILNIATGAMQLALSDMGGGFNDLIDGIRPLMGAISGIAEALHDVIGPILSLVGKLFKQIAGTLQPLGTIMQMIGSSLAPLFTILGGIMDILKIFQPILGLVSIAMLGLKLGIDYVNLGFQMFLDWILEKFGSNNNSGVEAAEKQVAEDLKKISDMAKQLEKDPFNAATGAAEDVAKDLEVMGEQANKTGKALDKLTGSLTNVPAGFRYNLAKYNATSSIDWAGRPDAGSMGMLQVNISGGVMMTVAQLTDAVLNAAKHRKWQKSGAPP